MNETEKTGDQSEDVKDTAGDQGEGKGEAADTTGTTDESAKSNEPA